MAIVVTAKHILYIGINKMAYLVIVMVEAGLAASNWLGLTPCTGKISFLDSKI